MIDISKVRQDTPGLSNKLFFNSAGASLITKQVAETVSKYLDREQLIGGYAMADECADEITGFYEEIGALINSRSRNIAYATNATDAYVKALSSFDWRKGDVILTTEDDYVSNYIHFLSLAKRNGVKIIRAGNHQDGTLNLDDFAEKLKMHKPKLVSVTHVPTSSGLVQDVERIGELVDPTDTYYLVDACQSIGQLVVDVEKIKCDFLSATGRKFLRGPRGTGFLYVSDRVLNDKLYPLYIDLQGADWDTEDTFSLQTSARRYELWEMNYVMLLGLKEATRYANELGMKHIEETNNHIRNYLKNGLSNILGVQQFDLGNDQSNIITLRKEGLSVNEICQVLKDRKVYFTVVEKKYAQYDFSKKGIDWAIRLSPHYFNTETEIDGLLNIIESM